MAGDKVHNSIEASERDTGDMAVLFGVGRACSTQRFHSFCLLFPGNREKRG